MNVDELFQEFLKYNGIENLYDHQIQSIKKLNEGKSLLLITPTTSGKSIVAYYGILRSWMRGLKSLYVVPLKALAEEKGRELKFFEKHGMRVKVSTGDYEESGNFIKRYDVIISTSEKADSLLRNSPDSFVNFGFAVIDEIHTLGSEGRGDTIEILSTKLIHMFDDLQLMAMSATINNYDKIAKWIRSDVVKSDFRPVPLQKYIIAGHDIYDDEGNHVRSINSLESFINETVSDGGQTIVFESTRKAAEKDAKAYSKLYQYASNDLDYQTLSTLSEVPGAIDLLDLIKKGIAYHHAGIVTEARNLIERMFLERKIKVLFATTTLAAGINLPARTVIIKSIYRYDGMMNDLIPNIEVQQMLGRAGRSRYDKIGFGYINVSKYNLILAYDKYINGPVEDVESQISRENLKKHILGIIASGTAKNRDELIQFFKKTFFAMEDPSVEFLIDPGIDYLINNDFIKETKFFRVTPFGKRSSELYIEPESALILRNSLELDEIMEILLRISSCPDIMKVNISPREERDYYHPDYEESVVKLANLLFDWINEKPEVKIIEDYNIYAADLRNRIESAEWLTYSLYEIGKVMHKSKNIHRILYYRVKYGIKDELIELVQLPFIGRVRARRLHESGYNLEKIAISTPDDLANVTGIGEGIAKKIIEHSRKLLNIN